MTDFIRIDFSSVEPLYDFIAGPTDSTRPGFSIVGDALTDHPTEWEEIRFEVLAYSKNDFLIRVDEDDAFFAGIDPEAAAEKIGHEFYEDIMTEVRAAYESLDE